MSVFRDGLPTIGNGVGRRSGLVGFVAAVARRWPLIAFGLAGGLAVGALSLSGPAPMFTAEARVHVAAPHAAGQGARSATPQGDPQQAQMGLILSRDLARTAIRDLDITLASLEAEQGASAIQKILRAAGLTRLPRDVPAEDRLLAAFTERLSVRSAGAPRQLAIGFTSADPELAVNAANRIAALYVDLYAHPDASNMASDVRLLAAAVVPARDAQRGPRSILAGFALAGLGLSAGLASLREWRAGRRARTPGPRPQRPHVPGELRLLDRIATTVRADRDPDVESANDAKSHLRNEPLDGGPTEETMMATSRAEAAPIQPASDDLPRTSASAEGPEQLTGAETPNFVASRPVLGIDAAVARIGAAGPTAYAQRTLVTHDEPHVDCAMTTLQIARALCAQGRVVLVGIGAGDRAESHERKPAPGLSDLLAGAASFSEVIHRDRGTRLHILPSGTGLTPAGADLDLVLDALSQTYDHVVLSASLEADQPVRDLALSLAPEADFVVLACASATPGAATSALRDDLLAAGAGEVFAIRAEPRDAERNAA